MDLLNKAQIRPSVHKIDSLGDHEHAWYDESTNLSSIEIWMHLMDKVHFPFLWDYGISIVHGNAMSHNP